MMIDLLPTGIFAVGVVLNAVAIVRIRSGRPTQIKRPTRRVAIVVSVLWIFLPYVAFWSIGGDPDVWDFYRSVWFVPALVLGGSAVWLIVVSSNQISTQRTQT